MRSIRVNWIAITQLGFPITSLTLDLLEYSSESGQRFCSLREMRLPSHWMSNNAHAMVAEGAFLIFEPTDADTCRIAIKNFTKTLPCSYPVSVLFTTDENLFYSDEMFTIVERMVAWRPRSEHALEVYSPTIDAIAFAETLAQRRSVRRFDDQIPPLGAQFKDARRRSEPMRIPLTCARREEDRAMIIASFLLGLGCPVAYIRNATLKRRMATTPQYDESHSQNEIW